MTLKTFTLARLKAICAFLGAVLTFATTVLPLPGDNHVWTGVAAVLTFIAVYGVPNTGYVKPLNVDAIPVLSADPDSPVPGTVEHFVDPDDANGDGHDDKTGRYIGKHRAG